MKPNSDSNTHVACNSPNFFVTKREIEVGEKDRRKLYNISWWHVTRDRDVIHIFYSF